MEFLKKKLDVLRKSGIGSKVCSVFCETQGNQRSLYGISLILFVVYLKQEIPKGKNGKDFKMRIRDSSNLVSKIVTDMFTLINIAFCCLPACLMLSNIEDSFLALPFKRPRRSILLGRGKIG